MRNWNELRESSENHKNMRICKTYSMSARRHQMTTKTASCTQTLNHQWIAIADAIRSHSVESRWQHAGCVQAPPPSVSQMLRSCSLTYTLTGRRLRGQKISRPHQYIISADFVHTSNIRTGRRQWCELRGRDVTHAITASRSDSTIRRPEMRASNVTSSTQPNFTWFEWRTRSGAKCATKTQSINRSIWGPTTGDRTAVRMRVGRRRAQWLEENDILAMTHHNRLLGSGRVSISRTGWWTCNNLRGRFYQKVIQLTDGLQFDCQNVNHADRHSACHKSYKRVFFRPVRLQLVQKRCLSKSSRTWWIEPLGSKAWCSKAKWSFGSFEMDKPY